MGTEQNDSLSGGSGANILAGFGGDNSLNGKDGNDNLLGHIGNDILKGGNNKDILAPGLGNDTVDGGSGKDYLLLSGARSDYVFSTLGSSTKTVTGPDGTDTFKNIDVIHFEDGTNWVIKSSQLQQSTDATINPYLASRGVNSTYFDHAAPAPVEAVVAAIEAPPAPVDHAPVEQPIVDLLNGLFHS